MIMNKVSIAGVLLSAVAAFAVVAEPALAGTCVPVTVKGRGPDPATATTKAAVKLTQRAASLRGKVKNSSTNCQKGPPGGFVCTTSAVVCP
ncbi:hypothetical protein [Methyloceanibacter sp.]|uniref:hypothetical protein n=1 Tax=Methyloceanibacter sp. TaxID=1965321 RepID=UPI003D6C8F07